ncbi:MAG: MarR family transcriptional regulator [Halioglobus sp.]|nr:MarR family transcriptional regulator [Halioglobus sp.]
MNDDSNIIATRLQFIPRDKAGMRLWLKLSSMVQLIETRIRKHLTDQYETTLPRFEVLSALERVPEGLTMVELSRWLMVTKGNITGIAERLSEDNLIERNPTPSDLRTFCLTLTPKGHKLITKMLESYEKLLEDMFEGITIEETDNLSGLLSRLKDNVDNLEQ